MRPHFSAIRQARHRGWALLAILAALLPLSTPRAQEYSFEIEEFEKKPYHLGGFLEINPVLPGLDSDAALSKLKFRNRDLDAIAYELHTGARLDGSLTQGIATFFTSIDLGYSDSTLGPASLDSQFFEGYLALAPLETLTFHAGKRALRWGKGYAWNPLGFVERPKDTNDPDLAREGFIMAMADYTRSFAGPLRTLSVSPVLLPVYEKVNEDFGAINEINFAGKIYLLLYDTDLDLLFLTGDSRPDRYGIDFSRNIVSNLEIHGEFAYIDGAARKTVDAAGNVAEQVIDARSYLLGLRYLSPSDTTWILEYYRNGAGFSAGEMRDFFSFVETGFESFLATGDGRLLDRAERFATPYAAQSPMRNYLYLRLSRKEPFDILYFTPAITGIVNLADAGSSIAPELLYTGITNLELRLKAVLLSGGHLSEYGEKQNDLRVDFRARYYF